MIGDRSSTHVAYRAVLLAAGLLLVGLLFRQLVTLMLAVLVTVIVAIALSAAAARLERLHIPRPVGALLALLGGLAALTLFFYLLIPPFVQELNEFVDDVPGIIADLERELEQATGLEPGEVGDRIQELVDQYASDPEQLIGPITAIGLNLAGILAALVLILITAYYMAARPEPLVEAMVKLAPPSRRDHVRFTLERLRGAWIGWMQGVAVDMLVTGVLLYAGLAIIGLDFAIFFAVLAALLVVVPYFGAIAGAIPPTLFALTASPGKALLVLAIYVAVQQIESNVTIPLVMSQTVRLHPAAIAIGVVIVGQLFGFVGLFVAVPILSLIVIAVEEYWIGPVEEADRERRRSEIELPESAEPPEGDERSAEDEADRVRPAS